MSERQRSLINTPGDHAVAEFYRAVREDRDTFILNANAEANGIREEKTI